MAKPIKSFELHYPMIQVSIIFVSAQIKNAHFKMMTLNSLFLISYENKIIMFRCFVYGKGLSCSEKEFQSR